MQIVKTYKTKAKWSLGHFDGVPVSGYYTKNGPYTSGYIGEDVPEVYEPGVNVLLHGDLVQAGMGRGRSSAYMIVRTKEGTTEWTLSVDGIGKLLSAIATGEVELMHDGENPILRGYWTFAKRGTEVSIIPAPRDVWA